MDQAAAHLLDFSRPFDCPLLDQIVAIATDGAHPNRLQADTFLQSLQENPDMWKRVDAVLETSKQATTKFFILQVLMITINTRWKVIPTDQREGIRNYIVSKIIALSASDELMRENGSFLNRLNLVLVQILKQDWPHNWPSFISDIVGSSKTSESLCENNMRILKLLSEEVFDFSAETMVSEKVRKMKDSLNEEFAQVFQLCQLVLEASQKPSLLLATLQTLQLFLSWISLGYIFETNLIANLLKYLSVPMFRIAALDCLIEIASLPAPDMPVAYRPILVELLLAVNEHIRVIIPMEVDLAAVYDQGSDEDQLLIQRIALFLGTYLKSFLPYFEQQDGSLAHQESLLETLNMLLKISRINDDELFKVCLDFWCHYAKEMYTHFSISGALRGAAGAGVGVACGGVGALYGGPISGDSVFKYGASSGSGGGMGGWGGGRGAASPPSWQLIFRQVLHDLRVVMIDHMAKPEEVIVVEDDNGHIVREMTKDTEVIAQYKAMREALVYLTHLGYEDTEAIMLEKLDLQVSHGKFTWVGLNTLCWAIGSVSGAMGELDEKRFLVSIIKDLLKLCESERGKDNKAVVASNIMYIVGQYPRFLRAHWKFLRTVVNKLFEFMHEQHPGVQDMACDTFQKIALKCKRKFMIPQTDDPEPYIYTLIRELHKHTHDLQPHQVYSFYESVGIILSDHGPAIHVHREDLLAKLMADPNDLWRSVLTHAASDVNFLSLVETTKSLCSCLRVNKAVCSTIGPLYAHQLSSIFLDMLNLFKFYSLKLKEEIDAHGEIATKLTQGKALRSVKADILDLLIAFFDLSKDRESNGSGSSSSGGSSFGVNGSNSKAADGGGGGGGAGGANGEILIAFQTFLPPLMEHVLGDYAACSPAARDARVLTMFASLISSLKSNIVGLVPAIMEALFEPTLELITTNMINNPEHRTGLFRLLREANRHCFAGLFNVASERQKLIVDSIAWAIKHTERSISESGLEILIELLTNVSQTHGIRDSFTSSFLLPLINDVIGIMTDGLHKSGFKLQACVMWTLFQTVRMHSFAQPLFDPSSAAMAVGNLEAVKNHVAVLLLTAFPNLGRQQVIDFVIGLFDPSHDLDAFKQLLRDFLIRVKQIESGSEAAAVVGNESSGGGILGSSSGGGAGGGLPDFKNDDQEFYEEERSARLLEQSEELRAYQQTVPGLLRPCDYDELYAEGSGGGGGDDASSLDF